MTAPPTFRRAPRLRPEVPTGEIEIQAPPPAPNKPSAALLPVLLPGVFSVVALAAMVFTAAASANLVAMLLSFGFMGISSLTAVLNYTGQGRAYRRALIERKAKYQALLDLQRQKLVNARSRQQAALTQTHPEPHECLARLERHPLDKRLWERAPEDDDFLTLRLGTGSQPFSVTIKVPKEQDLLNPDPLLQAARNLAQEFAQTPDVPICLPLCEMQVAGLAGPRSDVLNLARALTIQIATHHSPDEVKIVALVPAEELAQWDWLRWLPHIWTEDRNHRLLACERGSAHSMLRDLFDHLNRRRHQAGTAGSVGDAMILPHYLFIVADPRLVENEPIVPLLLRESGAVGATLLFLADRVESLPQGCRAVVGVRPGSGQLVLTTAPAAPASFKPDQVPVSLADRWARRMAPIRLQKPAASTEIPYMVTLLDLLGVDAIEDLDAASRWRSSEPFRTLAVPIGRRAGSEVVLLDLHERGQGPHGLVAGKTGSGKSELLQTLVASLAVQFHPHEVAFILIDYKGGGMAQAFYDLPHLVGTITNLQGSLAVRALAALKSELHRRETILTQSGFKHIDDYQIAYRRGQVRQPLPHLIVITDEFAELKMEQPDFMKELVGIARVGRSLGVHLILATQKPAGVVDEQIWANSSFRICLRVERPEDSQEVLKKPDAAGLARPGQAYLQFGTNPLLEFQAGWGGAAYRSGGITAADAHEIVEVALDGSRRPLRLSPKPLAAQAPISQLQALVGYLRQTAEQQGLRRLLGPWLAPLPDQVSLDQVRPDEGWDGQTWQPVRSWLEPVVGLLDDPVRQYQGALRMALGREGHLAVYGAPGSGKTVFLQSLVTSLALSHSPADVHMYLLDFGGRGLSLFSTLPHVGGVILADEAERLNRLLRLLSREIEIRKERLARVGVGTLVSYRATTGDPLPAIVIVLDNYPALAAAYPDEEDRLAQIARDGGNLGVHLVLTANSPGMVKAKLGSSIILAVALRLADRSEYSLVVGRTGGLEPAAVAGRGLVKGNPPLEFQTALPAAGDTEAERTAALKAITERLAQAWRGPRPLPVPTLPNVVPLSSLIPPCDAWAAPATDGSLAVPIGVDVDDLDPLSVDLNDGPHFLITGPAQCGKTTLLQSWLLALAERFPPARLYLYLVDLRRAGLLPFQKLPHCRAYITDGDRLGEALAEITQAVRDRRKVLEEEREKAGGILDDRAFLAHYPALVMAIEDLDAVRDEVEAGIKDRLEQLIRRERGLGFYVLLSGGIADLSACWDGWIKALKEMQTGFLLGSSEHNDLQLFNLRLPLGEVGKHLAAGQGYYGRRGRFRRIKAATPQVGEPTLLAWIARIGQREIG